MSTGGNEGITLAKMAVSASLLVLLIGAVTTLFYTFINGGNARLKNTEDSVRIVNMDKLYSLRDQSETADNTSGTIKGHPLVTSASAALLEHAEQDMLYVYVTRKHIKNGLQVYDDSKLFTYNNVTFAAGTLNGLPGYSAGLTYYYGDTILQEAAKYLQQWSSERCHVHVTSVPYGGTNLTGIGVEVLED